MIRASPLKDLISLGITAVLISRIWFALLNDREGPNLLIVGGMSVCIFLLSGTLYTLSPLKTLTGPKRLLSVIFAQLLVAAVLFATFGRA